MSSEAYSELSRTTKRDLFVKIVKTAFNSSLFVQKAPS